MNEAVFSMYVLKCFELGILPVLDINYKPSAVNEMLRSMSNEEARKAKRKFRKLWRKNSKQKTCHRRTRSARVHQKLYRQALMEFNNSN